VFGTLTDPVSPRKVGLATREAIREAIREAKPLKVQKKKRTCHP
jgi:hypothetical protein